ncbi:uncharacterized protein PFL1_05465 [Pseudozyma flocculosa PF-1]|uniref:Related to RRP46 - Exosome non-catalytic core component n=2 Tax=Pseudozyma flocculosa TaxID=84751 RepID=A0A5C3FCV5_9BASI|nr:uncharacterized protein PFL1_05465 [Pseudozyma flocculosa PF-1]EPQ26830.1 hypothetical protein PFL1_05465 [Pseudozyma flocculosa PF-1]SPO42100.1 related to RRP46 - Exosome non-catalytic core component [Pseudozyma flocculosa]
MDASTTPPPPAASSSRTSPTALRPLRAHIGCLARADGSATFSSGPLEVAASILGPTEVRIRDELTDSATLDIVLHPLSGVAGIPAKSMAASLHTLFASVLLLHHHPRSMIQLVLQTTSSPPAPAITDSAARARNPLLIGPDTPPSPSEKACLINAASLALLDAGIVARGTVAACSCAVLRRDQGTVLRQASGSVLGDAQIRARANEWRTDNGLPHVDDFNDQQDAQQDTIVLLDPTPTELNYALSTHVFAFSFSGFTHDPSTTAQEGSQDGARAGVDAAAAAAADQTTLVSDQIFAESIGIVSLEDRQRAADLCRQAARSTVAFIRGAMAKRVTAQVHAST